MILVKVIGGLGNQLFQYAFGRSMGRLHGTEVKFDITGFESYEPHSYGLKYFNISENLATEKEIARFKKYQRKPGKIWFLYNRLIADDSKYVQEKKFNFDPGVLAVEGDAYFDGYWQTEKYFKAVKAELRKEFTLKNPLSLHSKDIENEIAKTNAVSIHVRRGNLVTNPVYTVFHGFCSLEYYQDAIANIAKRVSSPHFFVFSDDYEWAIENLKSSHYPFTYVKNEDEKNYEDLILMSRCKHHIIANSSFSWWGAWLNPNEDKVVIAPKKWFNTLKMDIRDIVPNAWIKI